MTHGRGHPEKKHDTTEFVVVVSFRRRVGGLQYLHVTLYEPEKPNNNRWNFHCQSLDLFKSFAKGRTDVAPPSLSLRRSLSLASRSARFGHMVMTSRSPWTAP